ncbi:MAG TPA: 2-oxoglutarate dehydrogenase, E2 component, dihydrolipoamide succinyltransferase [Actinomycetota bacterium]|nr:2-oxoglutarate dehydrogenase, E2 component, dihydrolipoamide succinyltransferase [Actinomycetota bacterium]
MKSSIAGVRRMQQFKMPQLGETVLEATVTRWLKRPGDTVELDEPLVEVSTDKVDSEIPSPAAGSLSRILVQEGETVLVGAVMAEIDGDGGTAAPNGSQASRSAPPPPPPASPSTPPSPASPTPAAAADRASVPPPPAPTSPDPVAAPAPTAPRRPPAANGDADGQPFRGVLSPLVRKLAAQHGVDLARVSGTGTGGRITKQDVLDAASMPHPAGSAAAPAPIPASEQAEAPEAPDPSADGREQVVQVGAMRRAIAEHMVFSSNETARAWNTIEVDLTGIGRLRAQAGPGFSAREGFSLTWMPFVSKALTQALLRFPQLNSTWNGDGTITLKRYVNLGIAVALENGLIVPVVKGAETMNVVGLARAIKDVADRARSKKLTPDEVQGGTFTITNPGGFGSVMSVPIINRGQTAILAFDAVVKRPVVVPSADGEDAIAIRQMANLSISWDHRVIDGAEAAKFLAHLRSLLEEADFHSDLSGLLPE